MANGSVIVDMAAANGGNCELTRADEKVVTDNLVTDHRLHRPGRPAGRADLPALRHQHRQPVQAADPREGRPADPRHGRRGPARHDRGPGRREHVAAAAGAGLRRPGRGRRSRWPSRTPPKTPPDPRRKVLRRRRSRRRACSRCWRPTRPPAFLGHFTVFALAVFVGYYVISNVAHALHTPLMTRDQRDLRDHPGRRHCCRSATTNLVGHDPGRRSPCWSPASTSSAASW